ncbi:single-stranded DNA-binding protein [Rubritalea spongiae]|uniref:Single-stranded DNA-binding protein n=1 Tax=Rubritalea spongiae TaxID=430797 RepID=A0ABW5E1F2_9BACT
MSSFNKVMLMGNVTRDIEVRYTPKGTAVTDIGVACNRRVKQGEEWVDETTFVDVTLWGRTAELAGQYLSKGRGVFIEGRLQLDTWQDSQTGKQRSRLKVVGENMQFIGGGGGGGNGGGQQRQQPQGAPQQQVSPQSQQAAPPQQQGGSPANPMPQFEEEDDDIPF